MLPTDDTRKDPDIGPTVLLIPRCLFLVWIPHAERITEFTMLPDLQNLFTLPRIWDQKIRPGASMTEEADLPIPV